METRRGIKELLLPNFTVFQLVRFCVNLRVQYVPCSYDDDISALFAGFDEAVDEALWRLAEHHQTDHNQHGQRCAISRLLRSLPLHRGLVAWWLGSPAKLVGVRSSGSGDFLDGWFGAAGALGGGFAGGVNGAGVHGLMPVTGPKWCCVSKWVIKCCVLYAPLEREYVIGFLKVECGEARTAWFAKAQVAGCLSLSVGTIQHRFCTHVSRVSSLLAHSLATGHGGEQRPGIPNRCRCLAWHGRPNEVLHVLDDRALNYAEYHVRHDVFRDVLYYVMYKKLQGITMIQTECVLDGQENVEDFAADIVVRWTDGAGVQHERIVDVAVDNPAVLSYHPHTSC